MYNEEETLENECFQKACYLLKNNVQFLDMDIFQLTDLLIKLEKEKIEKNIISDNTIDYNDEIVSIIEVGEKETIDISVSGDNLFYCNDILTKNSFGLPATCDLLLVLIATDQLRALNQIMVKQLKNRYADMELNKRFVIGVDKTKMRLYDVENNAQTDIVDSGQDKPVMDSNKNKFKSLKVS